MGPEMLIPTLLSVGSTVMQHMSQRDKQKRQSKLADDMERYRMMKAREGEAAANKFLETQQPEARAATNAAAKEELQRGFEDSLGTAVAFEKPQNFAGKVTQDYSTRAGANQADLGSRLKSLIGNLATIGTPARRDFDTSLKYSDAAATLGAANQAADNVSQRYAQAIDQVRPDPFLNFASQLAKGGAIGLAGKKIPTGIS